MPVHLVKVKYVLIYQDTKVSGLPMTPLIPGMVWAASCPASTDCPASLLEAVRKIEAGAESEPLSSPHLLLFSSPDLLAV